MVGEAGGRLAMGRLFTVLRGTLAPEDLAIWLLLSRGWSCHERRPSPSCSLESAENNCEPVLTLTNWWPSDAIHPFTLFILEDN
ncbi:hypothetical protein J6590_094480 [Homalodisca vitripennis]|nr:hypothetical protein J6590_094480 [Homalodisca vitripennis]